MTRTMLDSTYTTMDIQYNVAAQVDFVVSALQAEDPNEIIEASLSSMIEALDTYQPQTVILSTACIAD